MTDTDNRVGALLESYLKATLEGSAPDREAFLEEHADVADALREGLRGLDLIGGALPGTVPRPVAPQRGAADDRPAEGRELGDFRILREVGRGGMGVVYEAEQLSLGRKVALKVLPFAAVLDPKQLQRFRNEAQAAAQLHHTNIVPVYSVGSERGIHYYAMQFIEGASLSRAIGELKGGGAGAGTTPISSHSSHREPAFLRMAARLGMQAAEALDHAHQLGVVHRDVKPGNLLVDMTGNLWVTDFGLARFDAGSNLTMTGDLVGTVRYMSPEQALAKRVPVDHRTDVYSLGATLYELFTLEPAVQGEDPQTVIQEIAFRDPRPPRRLNPAIPPDLETILMKAMAKDPVGRCATAQEMADDLRRFLDLKPIVATRPSVATVVGKWVRRHRALVGCAAAALAVSVVALAASNIKTSRALRKSEERLATAREAVRLYLGTAGVNTLRDASAPRGTAKALLERALLFYEQYKDDWGDTAVERGTILHALHRYPESRAAFAEALARAPDTPEILCSYAHLLGHEGRNQEALEVLDRALALDPRNHFGLCYRGLVQSALGRTEDALRSFDEALDIDPGFVQAHINRGNELRALRKPAEALGAHDRALKLDPLNSTAHNNRGNALGDLGQHEDALDAYRRATELDPTNARYHSNAGLALRRLGCPEEALVEHDLAFDLDPDDVTVLNNRAITLADLGRHAEALDLLDRALVLEPDTALVHLHRGHVLCELDRAREGIDAYDRALEIDDTGADAHCGRADAMDELGEHEAALDGYRRAIELDGTNVEAFIGCGNALNHLGRLEEALRAYRDAAAVDPGNARAHFGAGYMLLKLEHYQDALDAFDRALPHDPDHAALRINRGVALMALSRAEEALESFDAAVRIDGKNALAHVNRAVALRGLDRHADALRAIDDALRLNEGQPDALLLRAELLFTLGRDREGAEQVEGNLEKAVREPSLLNTAAWYRATSSDPAARDAARAVSLARIAVDLEPDEGAYWNTLGVAHYRAGAWSDALSALDKAVDLQSGGDACDWLFLAMTRWQLGEKDEARKWYGRAETWLRDHPDDDDLRKFEAEAAALLGK